MFKKRYIMLAVGATAILLSGCSKTIEHKPENHVPQVDKEPEIPEIPGKNPDESHEEFIPGIIDKDEPIIPNDDFDYSTQYDYSSFELTNSKGNFEKVETTYTALETNSIASVIDEKIPFPYGTISADIVNKGTDTGIIFGLSSNQESYREGAGISYYFYFVSLGGSAYLGKTDNGKWYTLGESTMANYNPEQSYNLKVVLMSDTIICYLNDEYSLAFRDTNRLKGTGFGIRSGGNSATISNLSITSEIKR